MLKEIGIESYYVLINTERGSVTAATPPNLAFDHAILAIALPAGPRDCRAAGGRDASEAGQNPVLRSDQ